MVASCGSPGPACIGSAVLRAAQRQAAPALLDLRWAGRPNRNGRPQTNGLRARLRRLALQLLTRALGSRREDRLRAEKERHNVLAGLARLNGLPVNGEALMFRKESCMCR